MSWEAVLLPYVPKILQQLVAPLVGLFKKKLDVGYCFASLPHIGNQIIIRNIGDKPIILTYWELEWYKKKSTWKSERVDGESPDEPYDVKLESFSSYTLQFQDADWFSTDYPFRKDQSLYILLYLAGKSKPVKRLVWKCQ